MDRFARRENVLLGYSPQSSFDNPGSSRDSDVDFNDVFGGPPRRSSAHEVRCNFGGGAADSRDAVVLSRGSPWTGLSEKPVFGEESANRRRYPSYDFYDDIFKGDDSYSSPRRSERDPTCSTPGSRVLSPARPLPPRTDPFGTSLPSQFSLPGKLPKEMDYTVFGSSNRSPYKYKDGTSNGLSCPYPPNSLLSRFSSQAIEEQDDLRNDATTSFRTNSLSHEFSRRRSDELQYMAKDDETDVGGILKEEPKSAEAPSNSSQFHFSIYKWAGIGVPMLMPLRGGNRSKLKEKGKIERCSSSSERIRSDRIASEPWTASVHDPESIFLNNDASGNEESFVIKGEKQELASTHKGTESCPIVEDQVLKKADSVTLESVQCAIGNVLGNTIVRDHSEKSKPFPFPKTGLPVEGKKKNFTVTQEARKPELKMHSLIHVEIEGQGNEDITRKTAVKENVVVVTKESHLNVGASDNVKKHDGKRINSNRGEVDKNSAQGAPKSSGANTARGGVKGAVKEFVKIFNQEPSPKPKFSVDTPSRSSRWKVIDTYGTDHEARVDNKLDQSGKQDSPIKTTIHKNRDDSFSQKDTSPFPESLLDTLGETDDFFQENFVIEELSHGEYEHLQTGEENEAIQVLDAKIRQWSNGKKGNVRSLLSTLQYVLWPESGWKPVPLMDIIEGSGVKRAYQRALLCLHPDKLQQKGASSNQKYIAEKVFDILQGHGYSPFPGGFSFSAILNYTGFSLFLPEAAVLGSSRSWSLVEGLGTGWDAPGNRIHVLPQVEMAVIQKRDVDGGVSSLSCKAF
ncbi:hypothetical protein RJ640_021011 [Escallonia rubra]|uniref:J domain-containing protein required for chloroplast accumulation response 1 n=1 Tax=Escallonia rubra TaxID=112253 RepID=A0AA88RZG9_9ASTE|nr:hypothetical protein RJ640_021011 [Escallonia rubra]